MGLRYYSKQNYLGERASGSIRKGISMSKEQDFAEVGVAMNDARKAFTLAYNDLGVEMQQGGTASKTRIGAVKDALKALDDALPKETRKKLAEAEGE